MRIHVLAPLVLSLSLVAAKGSADDGQAQRPPPPRGSVIVHVDSYMPVDLARRAANG
jgi:hypothetical protein